MTVPPAHVLRGTRTGVHLTYAGPGDRDAFIAAVRRSGELHRPWTDPPSRPDDVERYLAASVASAGDPDATASLSYLVRYGSAGDLVAVVNANNVVRRAFQSTALGFAAFRPQEARGRTRRGLALVLDELFGSRRLHRAEANVQPGNERSLALVRALGFRHEGRSPRMLHVAGAWRDHERFAMLAEDWPGADVAAPEPTSGGD